MSLIIAPQSPLLVLPGAAPFVGPLDALPATTVGFSLRRLLAAYTANKAIHVTGTGGATSGDVGFTSTGDFDSTHYNALLGAGTLTVDTWYDQSGNGNNITNAAGATQPAVVLNIANGHPVIRFVSANQFLGNVTITLSQPFTWNAVLNAASTGTWAQSNSSGVLSRFLTATNWQIFAGGSGASATFAENVWTSFFGNFNSGATAATQTVNGTTTTGDAESATAMGSTFQIGSNINMDMTEFIIFPSSLSSANETSLYSGLGASSQKTYYGTS